jgi:hypothetical protein
MSWRVHVERQGPLVVAIGLGLFHGFLARTYYPANDKDLFSSVVNLSGIAVGFLATGQALLCSLSDNFVVVTLKKLRQFDSMLANFTIAIRACLFLAVYTLLSYLVPFQAEPVLFSVWLGFLVFAALTTLRVLWHLGSILHGRH